MMRVPVDRHGWPLIAGFPLVFGLIGFACPLLGCAALAPWCYWTGVLGGVFMIYFFRDPERIATHGEGVLVSGADGLVRAVEEMREDLYMKADTVRVSVFLSPFNVHINRSPMAGKITNLQYTPGRHLLTIRNEASNRNEHSSILIEGSGSRCLVKQIVGPVVRRVIYWLAIGQVVARGERIGMMKFGSRLDMYFVKSDVNVLVKKGDRVRAGETAVASLKNSGR